MQIEEIQPTAVHAKKQTDPNLILIDVRRPEEYQQVHATYAKLIPLDLFEGATDTSPLPAEIKKDQEIHLICRSGARSRRAAEVLAHLGYQKLFNVTGGTMQWVDDDLPTEP